MEQYISVAPYLPGFDLSFAYIKSIKHRLSFLSEEKSLEKKTIYLGPQCFRIIVSTRTCSTVDTLEVVPGTYKTGLPGGEIRAEVYDVLAGKFLFSVYENESIPHPALIELPYDSSYYDDLKLLQKVPQSQTNNISKLYKRNKAKCKKKSADKWFTDKTKPKFLAALFQRRNEFINTTFLTKFNSYKLIMQDDKEIGFSIVVYSLGRKSHRLSYFKDGTTKIERNVHL